MAPAAIGGLVTRSLLTLVVVPVVSALFDDLGNRLRRRFTARTEELGAPAPARIASMEVVR